MAGGRLKSIRRNVRVYLGQCINLAGLLFRSPLAIELAESISAPDLSIVQGQSFRWPGIPQSIRCSDKNYSSASGGRRKVSDGSSPKLSL